MTKLIRSAWAAGSLRRQAESSTADLLGRPNWLRAVWGEHPHRLTFAAAAILAALAMTPWSELFGIRFASPSQSNAVSLGTGAWAVEGGLFALTAAITAVLVNVATTQRDRARLIAAYRSRAFDAVAAFSFFALLWTGRELLIVVDASAKNAAINEAMTSVVLTMAFDVAALGWLLVYSHQLLAVTTDQVAERFAYELRRAFRQMATREVADALLREWSEGRGLDTRPFAGFPSTGHPVIALSTAYVDDIRLRPLSRWLESLKSTVSGSKAIVSVGLDLFVSEGLQIGAISEGDAPKARGLIAAIRWRKGTAYTFDSALSDLIEDTQSAARDSRPATFSSYLEILIAAFSELFDMRARLAPLTTSLTVAMFGLAPEAQFRIRLRRLGYAVTRTDSSEIVNSWLYFVQEVLVRTRAQNRGSLGWVFGIWEQAAITDLPKDADLWLRLDEYSRNLDMWLATSAHEPTLVSVGREALGFLISLRNIITAINFGVTGRVEQLVAGLGRQLIDAWPNSRRPDGPIEERQAEIALALAQLKRTFWLGWMGEINNRLAKGDIDSTTAADRFSRNAERLGSFAAALAAWSQIGGADALDWQREQSIRQRAEAELASTAYFGGAVDPYAGTSILLALLAMRFGIQPHAPAVAERGLKDFLAPYLDAIRTAGYERWGALAGAASQEDFGNRLDSAHNALTEAGQHAAVLHERLVRAADVDADRVLGAVRGFLAGVDEVGIRLVRRLDEQGRVEWTDDPGGLEALRFQISYPKESLLEGGVPVLFGGMAPIAEREDASILARVGSRPVREVVDFEAMAVAIDEAIGELTERGMAPSLIVLPWDWLLTAFLLERDDQDPYSVRPHANAIGTYRGIELIRGLQWSDRKTGLVICVSSIGRLKILRSDQAEAHRRFSAEIRPPTDAEIAAWRAGEPPKSGLGIPFDGEDLEAVYANRWQLVLEEKLAVLDPNPSAVAIIRLVERGHQTEAAPVEVAQTGP